MNDTFLTNDPVLVASHALELARKVRAWTDTESLAAEIHDRVSHLVDMFEAPGVFSQAFVDELRALIAWCDAGVGPGIVTAYETHDAWDERGRETTAIHPVQVSTPEARQLCALLDDLRQMAGLVERTLDLVAAQAIVTGLRAASWASAPWVGRTTAPGATSL